MKAISSYQNNDAKKCLTKLQHTTQFRNYKWHIGELKMTDILTSLGLSCRQTRVYLALLKIGEAKAKTIADYSAVNRQEIYRVIEDLEHIGFAQRNICIPTTFSATPIDEVVKILIEQKAAELNKLRQKTKQLTKFQTTCATITLPIDKKPTIGTIFEADRAKKYSLTTQNVSQTIDIITSWKRFKQLTTMLENQLQNAFQKGAHIRIITEKPPNYTLPDWIANIQNEPKRGSLKLKILQSPATVAISIFDQAIAAIAFDPNTRLTKGPDLWTTNPTLLTLSQTHFNNIWKTTKTRQINHKCNKVALH
jgi:sugar-specific transcriptional regulator TrmB